MREDNRVVSVPDRIAEASALVDIARAKLDLEADRFCVVGEFVQVLDS